MAPDFISQLLEVVAGIYMSVVMLWVVVGDLETKIQQSIPKNFNPKMPAAAQRARRRRVEVGLIGLGAFAMVGGYLAVVIVGNPVRSELCGAAWSVMLAAAVVALGSTGLDLRRPARYSLGVLFLAAGILIRWLAR